MKRSAIPEYIWLISLVVISITLVILLKKTFSSASKTLKDIEITDVHAELEIKKDLIGGLWLEKLKFKIPKGVNKDYFINNLKLVCFDDKKGPLVINITELNKNFIVKDINNYYVLTKPIHLAGPDESTVFYYTFDDCDTNKNITKDVSGNNNHGILYGNPKPKCVKGISGYALDFFKTNQYISSKYANSISNRTLSYCAWVKLKSFNYENQFIYIKAINTGGSQRFFYFSSRCKDGLPYNCTYGGVINTDGSWGRGYTTQRHFKLNKWYFICQVVDTIKGKIEFWKDSKLFLKNSINEGDIPGKPSNIWIAGTPEEYQHLVGEMDEPILFNKVLKSYEIRTMYYYNCTKVGSRWFLYVGDIKEGTKLGETTVQS